jgi:hypothetical protein
LALCVLGTPLACLGNVHTATATGGGLWTTAPWTFAPAFPPPPPTPPVYPDNIGTTTFHADLGPNGIILSHPAGNVITILSLNIGAGGSLTWGNPGGFTLNIDGGPVNNAGVMSLNTGDFLGVGGTVDLSGPGSVHLTDPTSAIFSFGGPARMRLNGHKVHGQGLIGFSTLNPSITNDGGIISADVAGATLRVQVQSDLTQINGGQLLAENGGILLLNGPFIDNSFGTIDARDGSTVQLNNSTDILGGVIQTAGSGQILIADSTANRFDSLTIFAGSKVNLVPNADLHLRGTIVNNGTITHSVGAGTDIIIEGAVNLNGNGLVLLQDDLNHHISFVSPGGNSLTIGDNQRIAGAGDIGGGTNSVINNGLVVADEPGQDMRLFGTWTNNDTIAVANGGRLIVSSLGPFTNNGVLVAQPDSHILLNGADVHGGTLTTFGGGGTFLIQAATLRDTTSDALIVVRMGHSFFLDQDIKNSGTFDVQDTSDLLLVGDTFLSNFGKIKLVNGSQFASSGGVRTLTNFDNTIMGAGSLGSDSMSILNGGTIDANVGSQTLLVNPPPTGSVTNTNIMQASNGGILTLFGGTFNNNGSGKIIARENSTVRIGAGTTVPLKQQGNAEIRAEANATVEVGSGATIDGGKLLSAQSGGSFDPSSVFRQTGIGTFQNLVNQALIEIPPGPGANFSDVVNDGLIQVDRSSMTLRDVLDFGTSPNGSIVRISGGTLPGQNANLNVAGGAAIHGNRVEMSGVLSGGIPTASILGIGTDSVLNSSSQILGVFRIAPASGQRLELTNNGAISANDASGRSVVAPRAAAGAPFDLTNFNDIQAMSGATLQLSGKVNNRGRIRGLGGTMILNDITVDAAGAGPFGGLIEAAAFSGAGTVFLDDPDIVGSNSRIIGGRLSASSADSHIINPVGSTVTLDGSTGSGVITISGAGKLQGANASTTNVLGTFDFTSGGKISVEPDSNPTSIIATGAATFGGSGLVQLNPKQQPGIGLARITSVAGGNTLTLGSAMRIEGEGEIGRNGFSVISNGIIEAKPLGGANASNQLNLVQLGLQNNGTLNAASGATLRLETANVTNASGLINADSSAMVELTTATQIRNGTLQASAGGSFLINSATLFAPITTRGSFVIPDSGRGVVVVGAPAPGFGDTTWTNNGTVSLNGSTNSTVLRVNGGIAIDGGGAIVMSDNVNNGVLPDSDETFINIDNTIQGAGRVDGLINETDGTVVATGTTRLQLFEPGPNRGTLRASGSGGFEIFVAEPEKFYFNKSSGRIFVNAGSKIDVLDGVALVNEGQLTVHGRVTAADFFNDGGQLFGSGTINGRLINNGQLDPEPEPASGGDVGTLTIDGSFEQQGVDPVLAIEFKEAILRPARRRSGPAFVNDVLNVTGPVTLAGSLEVSNLGDGPAFLPGDQTTVMTFVSRTGDVTIVNNTGLAGLMFNKLYTPSSLVLAADALFDADANLDGMVDITDLGALASNWQMPASWLGGDFDGSGFVDIADLGLLATNWQAGVAGARPLGPSSFDAAIANLQRSGSAIPEPAAAGVSIACVIALASRRRSRSDSSPPAVGSVYNPLGHVRRAGKHDGQRCTAEAATNRFDDANGACGRSARL